MIAVVMPDVMSPDAISVVKRAKTVRLVITVLVLALAVHTAGDNYARADQSEQPAAEMLQDGLDALSDSQPDLASQLFEQLIQSYPGSPESSRAERELAALGVTAPQPSAIPEPG